MYKEVFQYLKYRTYVTVTVSHFMQRGHVDWDEWQNCCPSIFWFLVGKKENCVHLNHGSELVKNFKLLSRRRVTQGWLTPENTPVPRKSSNMPTARNEHSFHSQQPLLDPQVSQPSLMGIPVSQLQQHTHEEVSWFCRVLVSASSEFSDDTPLLVLTFQLFQETSLSMDFSQDTQLWASEYSNIIKIFWMQTKSSFLCPVRKRSRRGNDVLCTGCTKRTRSPWYPSRLRKAWRLWQIPQYWNLFLLSGYL